MLDKVYHDAIPPEGGKRYRIIYHDDGTVSFQDVTEYIQEGSEWAAADIAIIQDEVNNKVARDGDTMTGRLVSESEELGVLGIVVPDGAVKDIVSWAGPKDGRRIGVFRFDNSQANGVKQVRMCSSNDANGILFIADFGADGSNNRFFKLGWNPPATQNDTQLATMKAVHDVFAAGGTMGGDLNVSHAGETIVRASNTTDGTSVELRATSNWKGVVAGSWLVYRDNVGNVYVNGAKVPSGGTLGLEITRKSVSPAAVSVPNSTGTAVASISLEAGGWLIIGRGMFGGNATGSRQIKLSETSGDSNNSVSAMTSLGASPGTLIAEVTWTYSNTSAKTIYLNAWQNSGGALSVQGTIIALKYA